MESHIYTRIDKGEPKDLRKLLDVLKKYDGSIHISIEEADKRSDQFNRYYFGLLQRLSNETGYNVEDIHDINKRECNKQIRYVLNKKTGALHDTEFGGSTKHLKTTEFMEYLDRVRRFWAENGYAIPDDPWKSDTTIDT